ncbi:MAG: hypothetical protein PVI86_00480 [Phycisphaerae bacterium]|jgi:hypothetical protein
MYSKSWMRRSLWLLAIALVAGQTSCKREEASQRPAKPAEAAPSTEAPPVDQAAVRAMLAKADALDGTEDKIVTRCASCRLNMDGKPEHSLKALDYTMYFCSEHCAQQFGQDLTGSILAMNVPED